MEESTQMVDLPGEEGSSPILSPPMGYLRVFAQKAVEERNYPVAEGVCVSMEACPPCFMKESYT